MLHRRSAVTRYGWHRHARKWAAYRQLPNLRYYLMVDSERQWARVYFRDEAMQWLEQDISPNYRLGVTCDGTRLALTLDDLYEDTDPLRV